jgi:hypothetical protein
VQPPAPRSAIHAALCPACSLLRRFQSSPSPTTQPLASGAANILVSGHHIEAAPGAAAALAAAEAAGGGAGGFAIAASRRTGAKSPAGLAGTAVPKTPAATPTLVGSPAKPSAFSPAAHAAAADGDEAEPYVRLGGLTDFVEGILR